MIAIALDRPVNEVLEAALSDLHARLDGLGAPAPLAQSLLDYDLQSGHVLFNWDNGQKRRATAQLVGAAQPEPGGAPEARVIKWGWDEPAILDSMREPALRLRAVGQERGWEELTLPVVRMHVDRIWAFCGLAANLTGASGAVMCRAQGREVFLTIGPLQPVG